MFVLSQCSVVQESDGGDAGDVIGSRQIEASGNMRQIGDAAGGTLQTVSIYVSFIIFIHRTCQWPAPLSQLGGVDK